MTVKEANEALDRLFDYCEEIDNHIPEEERTGYDMLPDIQALRKFIFSENKGEWIAYGRGFNRKYKCDKCGVYVDVKYNFCPNCGNPKSRGDKAE